MKLRRARSSRRGRIETGSRFVEQPVDLNDAEDGTFSDSGDGIGAISPMSTPGIAIQITGLHPAPGNLYVVSGIISGTNVVSAGLYQNGVLRQPINLDSALSGVLGTLVPGSSHSVSFNAPFNPYSGPATIRAFDSTGAYTEQPIVIPASSQYKDAWSNPSYRAGSLPYGRSTIKPYRNSLGSTRPLW